MDTNLSTAIIYETLQKLSLGKKTCCASYKILVEKSGYCKNTVLKAVNELVLRGKVIKRKACNKVKGNLPNVYELV
jgi:hypothetical protein